MKRYEFQVYICDTQEEADEVHDLGYGRENITFNDEMIKALKEGKLIAWCDGEYTTQIRYEKDESNE